MSYVSRIELRSAYESCIQKKKHSNSAIDFDVNESQFLEHLYKALNTKNYNIDVSICFALFNEFGLPRREIFAAAFIDRVVHHLIVNRIVDKLEKEWYIDDSYSCKDGKGTLKGAQRLQEQLKEASNNGTVKELYVMKLDLTNCFNMLKKAKMYNVLEEFLLQFPDKNLEYNLWLIHKIMFHCPQEKGNYIRCHAKSDWKELPPHKSLFNCDIFTGIAVGNLTSQCFCNTFLTLLDKFIKETLGIKWYGRYVDDFFLIGTKEELLEAYRKICEFIESLGLKINKNKFYLQHYKKGIVFVGYMVFWNRMYILNTTKYKFYNLVYNWNKMLYEEYVSKGKTIELKRAEKIVQQYNSYCGLLSHVKGRDYVFKKVLSKNEHFKNTFDEICNFDNRFMLTFKKETKALFNAYYFIGRKKGNINGKIYYIT